VFGQGNKKLQELFPCRNQSARLPGNVLAACKCDVGGCQLSPDFWARTSAGSAGASDLSLFGTAARKALVEGGRMWWAHVMGS